MSGFLDTNVRIGQLRATASLARLILSHSRSRSEGEHSRLISDDGRLDIDICALKTLGHRILVADTKRMGRAFPRKHRIISGGWKQGQCVFYPAVLGRPCGHGHLRGKTTPPTRERQRRMIGKREAWTFVTGEYDTRGQREIGASMWEMWVLAPRSYSIQYPHGVSCTQRSFASSAFA